MLSFKVFDKVFDININLALNFNKKDITKHENDNDGLTIAKKIIQAFETHNIKKSQIPTFFGNNLTIKNTSSPEELLNVLNEDIIAKTCKMFNINNEWVHGESNNMYNTFDIYKSRSALNKLISKYDLKNKDCVAFAITPNDINDSNITHIPSGLIIILENIGFIQNKPIYRPFILNFENIRYWRTYEYFLQSIADILKSNINVNIKNLPLSNIEDICFNDNYSITENIHYIPKSKLYYEDLINNVDNILKSVDKELNNYGHIQMINAWLELCNNKRFDDIIGVYPDKYRETFENKQAKLQRTSKLSFKEKIYNLLKKKAKS